MSPLHAEANLHQCNWHVWSLSLPLWSCHWVSLWCCRLEKDIYRVWWCHSKCIHAINMILTAVNVGVSVFWHITGSWSLRIRKAGRFDGEYLHVWQYKIEILFRQTIGSILLLLLLLYLIFFSKRAVGIFVHIPAVLLKLLHRYWEEKVALLS